MEFRTSKNLMELYGILEDLMKSLEASLSLMESLKSGEIFCSRRSPLKSDIILLKTLDNILLALLLQTGLLHNYYVD